MNFFSLLKTYGIGYPRGNRYYGTENDYCIDMHLIQICDQIYKPLLIDQATESKSEIVILRCAQALLRQGKSQIVILRCAQALLRQGKSQIVILRCAQVLLRQGKSQIVILSVAKDLLRTNG